MQCESETIKGLLSQFLLQADRAQAPGDLDDLLERFSQQIAGERTKLGRLLKEKEVANRYPSLNVTRLRNWRARDEGPPYVKFGEARQSPVYYREERLDQWIMKNERLMGERL